MKHILGTRLPFKVVLAALSLGISACSSDDIDEQPNRSIEVSVFESILPKTDNDYNPKEWMYSSTMLFSTPSSTISGEQKQLDKGIVKLKDGRTINAAHVSESGVITGASYGTYTLLVFCKPNPSNAYLENRYTYKQLEYSSRNSEYKTSCLFVWDDMSTHKGYTEWLQP